MMRSGAASRRLTFFARSLPSSASACMRAREAAVSAVSDPEKNADNTIRRATAKMVMRISRGMDQTG